MKKTLIISYNFPPKSGISSRRWVKLAKELTRNGIECHVITRDGGNEKGVNWSKDMVELDPTKIHRLKNIYPRFLEKPPRSFITRIFKYIGIKFFRATFFKIDSAQFFYKTLIPKAKEIINAGVNNVIVTGPPHSMLFHASVLKSEHPLINLIIDYRDAWNDQASYAYKTSLRSISTKIMSIQMEDQALSFADKVFFVTDDMRKRASNLYKEKSNKFEVLHNFFDLEDYQNIIPKEEPSNDIVYLGTLGSGRRKALDLIAQAIGDFNSEGDAFKSKFHFYTNETIDLLHTSPHKKIIKEYFVFHPIVDTTEVSKVILRFRYCLSINAPDYSHAFGTKIFDYLALKKLVFHISNGGELYNILEDGGHLISPYDTKQIKVILKKINTSESNHKFNKNFSQFDLKNQVKKVINTLKV
jgi:glycosyltransferase involved in cell wall biosynthesis